MVSHDKKLNLLFLNWLITCFILIFSMIIIGGLTRLTDSGLSITEWELFREYCHRFQILNGMIIFYYINQFRNLN